MPEATEQLHTDDLVKKIEELTERVARLEAKCNSADKPAKTESSGVDEGNDKPQADAEAGEKQYEPWQVRLIINKRDPDSKTGERKDFEEIQVKEPGSNVVKGAAATLTRFVDDSKSEDNYGELEILNDHLRELLKGILRHHPTHAFYDQPSKILSPYEPLVMNWDLLLAEVDKEEQSEEMRIARKGLGEVLEALRQSSGDTRLDDYFRDRDSLLKSKSITFDTLWTIFPPGTIVYGRPYLKTEQVFIVQEPWDFWPASEKKWYLRCWTYDWNGEVFRRISVFLGFNRFRGTKAISSLPYYPLEEVQDRDELKRRLIERGKKYWDYCTAEDDDRRFRCNGKAIADKTGFRAPKADTFTSVMKRAIHSDASDDEGGQLEAKELIVKGEVMIDFASYYLHGPQQRRIGDIIMGDESDECTCPHCSNNHALAETFHRNFDDPGTDEWDNLQYMLCPPRILGYILREKLWAQLHINDVSRIRDSDAAFKSKLHLRGDSSLSGEETKDLLRDLVITHGQGQVADLVEAKGKGLVILLYGNPGVGKTSTAETLAAAAQKTLFNIGVADVGTKARDVESNLRKIFELATKWKAILLIDEVDVFVQSRGMGHQGPTTERNALVSVFLRVLEYYQGILILTTNQIALFDVAIQSRIHIAIKFEELDKNQSIKIFAQQLDQYNEKGLVADYARIKKYGETDLPKKGFDGRQLRNIVASAIGRAQARQDGRKRMELEDIEIIVSNMASFKQDLDHRTRTWHDWAARILISGLSKD